MLQIESKKTIESTAIPGVTFTVRRLNRVQRAKRDFSVMDARVRFTAAIERYRELQALKDPAKEPDMRALDYEAGLIINQHLKPASIAASLVAITGLEIDGKSADAAALINNGTPETDDLLDEIYAACEAAAGLNGDQSKNSQSPSTSPVPMDGETGNSSAEAAA